MDYTDLPRYYVYKDKKDIDDFSISDPKSMDGFLFNFLQNSRLAGLANAAGLFCSIFNTAHYIATLIHMEKHPLLHIVSYLDKADHVGADGPRFVHTRHLELRAVTMGLVCNYLRVLSPEHLDVKAFLRAVHDQIEGSEPSTGARLSVHMVGAFKEPYDIFYEITHLPDIQSHTLLPEDFRPRPIIEALQESNYRDIAENLDFIKLRIGQLSDEEQLEAKKIIQRVTKDTGEKALEGAMPEAAEYIRKMVEIVAQEFGLKLSINKQQNETADDDIDMQAIINRQKQEIEDLKRKYEQKLSEAQEKFQDLEKKVEELQSSAIVEERTAEAIAKLMIGENKEYAREFVDILRGLHDNVKVADLIKSYEDKFTPKVNITNLWSILYVSLYYSAGLRNLSKALRDRHFQE